MRRWLVLPVAALLAVGACGGKDDVEGADDDEPVVVDELGTAVDIARLSLPAALDDDVVGDLIRDLCSAAGSGDIDPVVTQLVASEVAPDQLASSVDALAAGAGTYCPDDVDEVVPQVQQALAPATTVASAAEVGPSSGSGTGGSGSTGGSGGSARSSASASSSGTGGTSTESSGSANVGGGNASGTGNQSSTGFSQGVSSSNSSSSGGSSASSASTG